VGWVKKAADFGKWRKRGRGNSGGSRRVGGGTKLVRGLGVICMGGKN